jgi:hypothetical protein
VKVTIVDNSTETKSDSSTDNSAEEVTPTLPGEPRVIKPGENAVRIRFGGGSPAPHTKASNDLSIKGSSTVRIRDIPDEHDAERLQLTSAQTFDSPPAQAPVASSRRNTKAVDHLPQAVESQGTRQSAKAASPSRPAERVSKVQSARPQSSTKSTPGRVTDIDARAGNVRFSFDPAHTPAVGTLVKVHHKFLLGEEVVGALEVTSVAHGVATAKPVGNLSLGKLSLDDQVTFQGAATRQIASRRAAAE